MGTFHFGATSDKNKTAFPDLETPKRQAEIEEILRDLARFRPDKIFVEAEPSEQAHWDGVLAATRAGTQKEPIRDEVFQIGVRLAARLPQSKLLCIDNGVNQLDYGKIEAFSKAHEKDPPASLNAAFFEQPYPIPRKKPAPKLAQTKLKEYYLHLNSAESRLRSSYDYTHYAIGYGKDNDYTGADFAATWYKRNLYMFTNMLRHADVKDKRYFLLVGAGHVTILRHFFESNPHFEVIDCAKVLRT
jgi:Family of unknown function (DUF5694)